MQRATRERRERCIFAAARKVWITTVKIIEI